MREWIEDSLLEIERLVPSDAWNVMKTTDIYVNDKYYVNGELKGGAWMHWSEGWLEANGLMVEKEGHVEINSIGDILAWRDQQPSVLLHEMAHAYHWRQGHHGQDFDPTLKETYDKAMKDGKYDSVKHWVGSTTKHYATTNPSEYFAECVEAFFSSEKFHNDMYPFNREELKEFDPDGFDMVAKVFNVDTTEIERENDPALSF